MAYKQQKHTRSKWFGLNLAHPKFVTGKSGAVEFHEASDINNIKLDHKGGFSVRKGRTKVGTITEDGHSLGWFTDYANNTYLMVAGGDKIFKDPGGGGSPVNTKTLTNADQRATMASFLKYLWYVDGSNGNLKWEGTNWYQIGVSAPAAKPTIADGGAGALTGTFRYFYTYVYKDATIGYAAESNTRGALFSDEITVAAKNIDVTVLASADPQVSLIRIYRISSVAAEWQRVAEIGNANTTHTDDVVPSKLLPVPEYMFEGEPLDSVDATFNMDGIVYWKNRLWAWDDTFLYHTREGRPEKWFSDASPDYQPILLEPDTNEKIIAVFPVKNLLAVFTEDKMRLIVGDTEPFAVIEYRENIGCIAPRSLALCMGRLFWLSKSGVFAWNGSDDPEPISEEVNLDFEGANKGILNAPSSSLRFAKGIYVDDNQEYWLSVPFSAAVFNSRTFTYSLNVEGATDLSPWGYLDDLAMTDAIMTPGRKFYSLKSEPGSFGDYMLELQGNQDEGVDVANAYYETRHWDFGDSMMDKKFFYIAANGYTTGSAITFKTIFDFGQFTDSFDLEVEGDEFDVDDWDEAMWVGSTLISRWLSCPQEAIGMAIGYRVEMDKDATFYSAEAKYKKTKRYMV